LNRIKVLVIEPTQGIRAISANFLRGH